MKKRLIAVFLAVCILCSMTVPVSANEQESNIVPSYEEYCHFVENMYRTDFNPKNRLYLLTLDACSEWGVWIERASGLIEEDLSVDRCTEILANMVTLMNYQLENAIVEQASVDMTKTLLDYAVDLADIATGAIGSEALQKGADVVMKRIATVAGITDGFLGFTVDTVEDLELLVQLEGDYMMQYDFLETVYMYSDIPEMRDAAQSLILANNKIMEYKLDTIISVGGSFAKFEAHDVFLDQVAGELFENLDFLDTETFPLFALAKVYACCSAANLAFDIGLFIGDTFLGTSDIYNRYNEMLAMRDIHTALLSRVKANPALNETDYGNMDRNISFMKMALYVDTRGEYCVYKMVTEDGKLLSHFSSSNKKSVDENYQISLKIIQNTLDTLDSLYGITETSPKRDKLLTRVNVYWDDNLAHTYILQYNENRQLSGAVFTEFDGYTANFSFSYDKDGRLLVADRDDYWLYFGNDEYVYNNSGQLISHKHYWGGGSIPYYQLDYEYDEQGILIGETHLDFNYGDDALEISSVYSYSYIFDSHGRVIEKQQHIAWTDSDGDGITKYGRYRSSEYVTVTRYLYDSLGRVQTVYSAYIPKSLCNPQGNPDLEWDDQTYYNYDYAPLVLVQSANGDSSVQIQDSAGKIIWSQSLGDNTLNTDAEGYILGSTDTYNAYRYELFYGDEIYDDQNVT